MMETMKLKRKPCILCLACLLLWLTGCASLSPIEKEAPAGDSAYTAVGGSLEIRDLDTRLTLRENMDVLSADGLYYASWSVGDSRPYENSDGDTADLYDAQLHLLLGESQSPEKAGESMDSWLATAKSSYEILEEEALTAGGRTYTLLTYSCTGEDNPYARGLSAFGAFEGTAVCVELTCMEEFSEDLRDLLTGFLECCSYSSE